MPILIISDDPERMSFSQILILKQKIQRLFPKVDLFIFSKGNILLNQKLIGKTKDIAIRVLENILKKKKYNTIIISLSLNNLKKFLPKKRNVLEIIKEVSPRTDIFIFGASSLLNKLKKEELQNVFLFSRPGVNKLTIEFRNTVINHLQTKTRSIE